jgi:hypothetical protein
LTIVLKCNKIKCANCELEFEVKDIELKSKKVLKNLLGDLHYLNAEKKSIKQKLEESIRVFFKNVEEFQMGKTKLDLECHNHFQELRFQIELHREKLKEKIENIALEMIDKTKIFEATYLKSLN